MTSSPATATRRKSADDRRAELIEAAGRIAVGEGLDRVTAKRVGHAVGVFPGLVTHYFRSADDLIAAAFGHAASTERDALYGHAESASRPVEQLRRLLGGWLEPERDPVSMLWLDAWQASRRRPALRAEVGAQMDADLDRLERLIRTGVRSADYRVPDPRRAALRIIALVDGLSIQAVVRSTVDYAPVADLVLRAVERELGLPDHDLQTTT